MVCSDGEWTAFNVTPEKEYYQYHFKIFSMGGAVSSFCIIASSGAVSQWSQDSGIWSLFLHAAQLFVARVSMKDRSPFSFQKS